MHRVALVASTVRAGSGDMLIDTGVDFVCRAGCNRLE